MTRIYLAGPMSGLPELNYPAFHAKAAELRAAGHHVENPAENPAPPCGSWQGYMRLAIAQLVTCDAIYLLPGWRDSRGARVERRISRDLGLSIAIEPRARSWIEQCASRFVEQANLDVEQANEFAENCAESEANGRGSDTSQWHSPAEAADAEMSHWND